jgi:hypothetical protein
LYRFENHDRRYRDVAVCGVAYLLSVGLAARSRLAAVGNGCIWDGWSYCRMAVGELGERPFNRRPLVPLLARLTGIESPPKAFLAVDLIAIAVLAIGVWALTRRCVDALGGNPDQASAAATIAACLVMFLPHLHSVFFVPVFTDYAAAALAVAWCALLVSRRPVWSVPVALLAGMAREQNAMVIVVVGLVTAAVVGRLRTPAIASSVVALMAALVDLHQPWRPGSQDWASWTFLETAWRSHSNHPVAVVASMLFAVGLPVFAVVIGRRALWRSDVCRLVLSVALIDLAIAPVAGSDTGRIAFHGAPFLVAAACAWFVVHRQLLVGWIVVVGSLLVWRPWLSLPTDPTTWLRRYTPQDEIGSRWVPFAAVTLVVAAAAVMLMVGEVRVRHNRDRASPD